MSLELQMQELQQYYSKMCNNSGGDLNVDDSKAIVRTIIKDHKKTLSLLYQLLPPKIVSRLRHGEQILPESFHNVTIFFSDIGIIIIIIIRLLLSLLLLLLL
jgi:hypothetical protein